MQYCGLDGLRLAGFRIEIGDGDAGAIVANLLDHGLIADDLAESLARRPWGYGPCRRRAGTWWPASRPRPRTAALARGRHRADVHRQGIDGGRFLLAGAGRNGEARSLRSLKEIVGSEVAVFAKKDEHALLVFGGDVLVERALVDAFGEQFGDVAAGVVDHPALLDGLAAIQLVGLHERAARGVDLDLEGNVELAAITEHGGVDRRQTGGAEVLVVAFFPVSRFG